MNPLLGRCPSPPSTALPPSHVSHLRKFRARRHQPRVRSIRSVPLLASPLLISHTTIPSGLYLSLFAVCVGVLYNKRRRRGGGNYRLILVSGTLFVLITWVRLPPCLVHTFHSFLPQHLVLDIVRIYIAFHKSETDQGADSYYFRVTSTTSIMKTSIYLMETVVSDLFIVRTYPSSPFALYRSGRASSYIGAILYGTRASP
jgi:hypothetical protein